MKMNDKPNLPTVTMVVEMGRAGYWALDNNYSCEVLGLLPLWVSVDATPSMIDEIHENYGHGGGWQDFKGFNVDIETGAMTYPGDPVQYPIAMMVGDSEVIWLYSGSWVTVMDRATKLCRTARID